MVSLIQYLTHVFKYTFVDHDRLAKHVMRENHNGYTKEGYGRLNPIGYFDYPDFESLEAHLDMVLHKRTSYVFLLICVLAI